MRKIFYPLFIAVLMFITGCDDTFYDVYNDFTGPVESVSLPKTASIVINTTERLDAKVYPSMTENKNVTWIPANGTGQITIDQYGNVKGVAVGDATVTVTTVEGGFTAQCVVTVVPYPIPIQSITLPTTLTIGTGQQHPFVPVIDPADATSKEVTWESSSSSVVAVDSTGKITAVTNGTADITVTSVHWNKTSNVCKVTVGDATYSVTYDPGYTGPVTVEGGRYKAGFPFTVMAAGTFTRPGYTFSGWKNADGTTTYTPGNASNMGTSDITIYAQWMPNSTIVFADGTSVARQLGSGIYTNIVTGAGSGVITYTSGTTATATVNVNTGAVTLVATGTTVITANKAADVTYAAATNTYTLTVLTIGSTYQGGKVAYFYQVGDTGYDPNVLHGLIAATADQNGGTGIIWSLTAYKGTSVGTSTTIGSGKANTDKIIAQNDPGHTGLTTYAAGLAHFYNGGGYSDWYLPSSEELNKLYLNRASVGGFANEFYWSSSEGDATSAVSQKIPGGGLLNCSKDTPLWVRAVRAF